MDVISTYTYRSNSGLPVLGVGFKSSFVCLYLVLCCICTVYIETCLEDILHSPEIPPLAPKKKQIPISTYV